jgi:N-acetylmuramoyl-L-alanine amidase CwlA
VTDLIKEFIAPGRPNRPGTNINVKSITIHNTSNSGRGANAKAHSRFVRETGFYMLNERKNWVSWHFTVDDATAIQHLPINEKAFHAGAANGSSIGIEICMHQGIDQQAADERAAQLVATLLRDLELSADSVRTHESWTGKKCPTLLRGSAPWAAFLELIRTASGGLESEPEVSAIDPEEVQRAREPADPAAESTEEETDIDHEALEIPPHMLDRG